MNGKTTRTRSASGHETTRSRHQTRKTISVFTSLAFHSQMKGQSLKSLRLYAAYPVTA